MRLTNSKRFQKGIANNSVQVRTDVKKCCSVYYKIPSFQKKSKKKNALSATQFQTNDKVMALEDAISAFLDSTGPLDEDILKKVFMPFAGYTLDIEDSDDLKITDAPMLMYVFAYAANYLSVGEDGGALLVVFIHFPSHVIAGEYHQPHLKAHILRIEAAIDVAKEYKLVFKRETELVNLVDDDEETQAAE